MCLAVPMTLIAVDDEGGGVVELQGVERAVRLDLLDDPTVGDIVIVHAGYAIETLAPAEAAARMALFADLAARYEEGLGTPVQLVAPPPQASPASDAPASASKEGES